MPPPLVTTVGLNRVFQGPATRLQWGSNYFGALIEMSPEDTPRIEKAAAQLFAEAEKDPGAFYERSERSLKKVATLLAVLHGVIIGLGLLVLAMVGALASA